MNTPHNINILPGEITCDSKIHRDKYGALFSKCDCNQDIKHLTSACSCGDPATLCPFKEHHTNGTLIVIEGDRVWFDKKEDKNGHKINTNGELIFDDRCKNCEAPKDELPDFEQTQKEIADQHGIMGPKQWREYGLKYGYIQENLESSEWEKKFDILVSKPTKLGFINAWSRDTVKDFIRSLINLTLEQAAEAIVSKKESHFCDEGCENNCVVEDSQNTAIYYAQATIRSLKK